MALRCLVYFGYVDVSAIASVQRTLMT